MPVFLHCLFLWPHQLTNTMKKVLLRSLMLSMLVGGLAQCKKKSNDKDDNKNVAGLTTQHLSVLHKQAGGADGSLKALEIRDMSVTADGRIHVLYNEGNNFGPSTYFRRVFNANGDSVAAPSIHANVINIANNNDVSGNWAFAPYSEKLTLGYHPASSYSFQLYYADQPIPTYTYSDASFGGLPRECYNGDMLAAYGYGAYYSNPPYVYMGQAYFTWQHGTNTYKQVYNHNYPMSGDFEDQQRRCFAGEPLDDNTLGLCFIDGSYIYLQAYDRNTGITQTADSMACTILKPISRIISGDANMQVRTSRDGQSVIFFVKYESGAFPSDGNWNYATFVYNKSTKKLSKVVQDFALAMNVAVNFDNEGNLIYASADDQAKGDAWGVYRVGSSGSPVLVAHVAAKNSGNPYVSCVKEYYGKIYINVSQWSVSGTTQGPVSYLMVVQ